MIKFYTPFVEDAWRLRQLSGFIVLVLTMALNGWSAGIWIWLLVIFHALLYPLLCRLQAIYPVRHAWLILGDCALFGIWIVVWGLNPVLSASIAGALCIVLGMAASRFRMLVSGLGAFVGSALLARWLLDFDPRPELSVAETMVVSLAIFAFGAVMGHIVRREMEWLFAFRPRMIVRSADSARSADRAGASVPFAALAPENGSGYEGVERRQPEQAARRVLTDISHILRTPVTAIRGYAEALVRAEQDPVQQRQCVEVILRSSQTLVEAADRIQTLLELEGGTRIAQPKSLRVEAWLMDTRRFLQIRLARGGSDILEWSGPLPVQISADPDLLCMLALNLVVLGRQYRPGQRLRLCLSAMADDRGCRLCFRVLFYPEASDTAAHPQTESVQLTELGRLSERIIRLLIWHMGGEWLPAQTRQPVAAAAGGGDAQPVDATVHAGHQGDAKTNDLVIAVLVPVTPLGEQVWREIELAPAPAAAPVNTTAPTGERAKPATGMIQKGTGNLSGHILVAEDNPDLQLIMAHSLRQAGLTCQTTTDGAAALAALEAGGFDAAILDIRMPELSGLEVLQHARERGLSLPPCIALTANTAEQQVRACREAGFKRCIAKPFETEEVITALSELLAPTDRNRRRVLLVEDDVVNGTLLMRQVSHVCPEWECELVSSGEAARTRILDTTRSPLDLVLLDWELPGLSGLDLLQNLPAESRSIPIYMITGHNDPESVRLARDAGARDVLVKPVSLAALRELLLSAGNAPRADQESGM